MSNDSYVEHGKHSTTLVGPDAMAMARAFALASALNLYAETGIKPTAAFGPVAMLKAASQYTGKKYKRTEYLKAAEDLNKWGETMRAALPHIEKTERT